MGSYLHAAAVTAHRDTGAARSCGNPGTDSEGRPALVPAALRTVLLATAVATSAAVAVGAIVVTLSPVVTSITLLFLVGDTVWLALITGILLLARSTPARPLWVAWTNAVLRRPARSAICIALFVVFVAFVGAHVIFEDFALSRDEFMAHFDATVFEAGHFAAPVAPEWRPFVLALAPEFQLPIAGGAALVSAYLPGNAVLQALFGLVGFAALANAVLGGVAVVAMMGIARRLWPDRPDAAVVAVVLLATSSQFLVNAMTPYAMTAHLAFNLTWLWLFLRDDRIGHGGAACVGFFACGLHQVIFHPLFIAPFVLHLWTSRRWRLAAFYTATYAAICIFWVLAHQMMLGLAHLSPAAGTDAGAGSFVSLTLELLRGCNWSGLSLMAENLMRFVTWQNPLVLPFAVLAAGALVRGDATLRALAVGILLVVVAMSILLPYQGLGWGYRYLHGLLGSVCLLATQGWVRATTAIPEKQKKAAWSVFWGAGVFSLLVLFAGRAYEAHRFVSPYAAGMRAIERKGVDVVIVDASQLYYGSDLVRNDPFLRNRPKVLALRQLDQPLIRSLCNRYRVATFDHRDGAVVGIPKSGPEEAERLGNLRSFMKRLSCGQDHVIAE